MKKFRLSPALVVSMVALFVALGGVGYAATTIGSAQIKNNSVRGKDIRNGTIVSKDINTKTRKALKGQTGDQGPAGPAGGGASSLYAVVNDPAGAANTTLARGKGVVSVAEGTGVTVQFNQDVSNCSWLANRNGPGTAIQTAGWAQVALSPTGNDSLNVRVRNEAGTLQDGNFHVVVFC
jgi:hypothetical protein